MEKWVLRLVLAVLTVVTCCFVFRNTETKDRSLLYQKVQTMAEDYLGRYAARRVYDSGLCGKSGRRTPFHGGSI